MLKDTPNITPLEGENEQFEAPEEAEAEDVDVVTSQPGEMLVSGMAAVTLDASEVI